jgi:hypothetical protein
MPLYRRLPKIVGKGKGRDGHQKTNFGLLKLSVLNKMPDNSEVPLRLILDACSMCARFQRWVPVGVELQC